MDPLELLRLSRREQMLYRQLIDVYRGLRTALADAQAPVGVAWIAAEQARAETVSGEIRLLGAVLASHRLTGASVSPEVRDLWRETASLATEAVDVNADVTTLARARRAEVATRLTALGNGRRALAAYRPRAGSRPALTA